MVKKRGVSNKFNEDSLRDMYLIKNLSMREIAKKFDVGKTTIEYYFKKFNIPRRNYSEFNKLSSMKYGNWIKGLNKTKDPRVLNLSSKIKEAYKIKREKRIKALEEKYGQTLKQILNNLYWKENLTQEKISKELKIDRRIIIELMNQEGINKRPNFEHISSLKGKQHAMYGKTWESVQGIDVAEKRRKEFSTRARKFMIRRLENNEMPFLDTKIEKAIAEEMGKRKIPFYKQFVIGNKFVCDFAIPQLKIAIECDGDYWHANPEIYVGQDLDKRQIKNVNKDKFKKIYLAKRGWTVLNFFESEIKSSVQKCVDKVEETIKLRTEELKKIPSPIDNLMKI